MPNWLPGVLVVLILFPLGAWALTYAIVRGLSWLRYLGHWCCILAFLPLYAHASNGIMRDGFEPEGWCPAGRVTHTVVSWRYDGIGRRLIDVRRAENLWGRWDAGQTPVDYPWLNVFAMLWQFPRHGYLGAEFDIAPWVPMIQYNRMTHGETSGGPWTDISVSDWCGDFNPPDPWCMTDATYTGHSMGIYKLPEAPVVAGCTMQPLGRYFLNVRFTFPDAEHWDCGTSACRTTIQNNRNP